MNALKPIAPHAASGVELVDMTGNQAAPQREVADRLRLGRLRASPRTPPP